MHASERHSYILSELSRNASVSIKHLTETLGISRETIRKDLELLSKQGKLNQVRGGAVRILDLEPPLEDRLQTNPEGKAAIAELVVDQIPEGASIMIDGGSTAYVAAEHLTKARKDLVIYTNDIHIALMFGPYAAEINVIGGRLDVHSAALFGLDAIEFVKRYRTDFALVGVAGLNDKVLFTDYSRETAVLRESMIASSERTFILADSSKFGNSGRCSLALNGDVSLVTDSKPDSEILRKLAENGVKALYPLKF